MGEQYPYYKRRDKNIVVVLHIYGTSAIFLLFCDHQDTEYESLEMDQNYQGKNIKVSMEQLYIYSTRWDKNCGHTSDF